MACDACSVKDRKIAELEDLVREYERQRQEVLRPALPAMEDPTEVNVLRLRLRLTPTEARIVYRLDQEAPETWVRYPDLYKAVGREANTALALSKADNVLKVQMTEIRKKIGHGAVECISRVGYRLTAEGRALMAKTFQRAPAEAAA